MKHNFKILIVDDEVLIAEFLKDILQSLGYSNLRLAHNKDQAIVHVIEFMPDLVLLDIRMNGELEGIEIAEEISLHYKTPFLFITAHSDKIIVQKALDTKPVGYITKPFKKMDIYAAVHLVEINKELMNEKHLVFKDGFTMVKLSFDDLLYVQSDDNYIHIYAKQKKYTLRTTLGWFKENTPEELFRQIHRSYIINMNKITKTTSKSVFIDDTEIPVSRGNQIKFD